MKKLLTLLLCVMMVVCFMPTMAFAAENSAENPEQVSTAAEGTFTVSGIRYLITGDSTVSVISTGDINDPFGPPGAGIGSGTSTYSGEINIPETVQYEENSYSVTGIRAVAFKSTSITRVSIPSSVTIIGTSAFQNCTTLEEVQLSEGLQEIGYNAFCGCVNLSVLSIPSTVTKIGTSAFGRCDRLMNLDIPAGVTEGLVKALVGNWFYPHLDKVTIASGSPYEIDGGVLYKGTVAHLYMGTEENVVVRAGTTGFASAETGDFSQTSGFFGVFSHNTKVKSVTLPDTIKRIPARAFHSAVNLKSVVLPEGITAIGDFTFYNTGLLSIDIPDTVESIGANAFQGAISMTSIDLPSNLKTIGQSAFADCSKITVLDLPNGLTTVGKEAFKELSSLKLITIPSTVTSLGVKFLSVGESQVTVVFEGSVLPTFETEVPRRPRPDTPNPITALDGLTPSNTTVYYPAEAASVYNGENSLLKEKGFISSKGGDTNTNEQGYSLTMTDISVEAGKTYEINATIPSGAAVVCSSSDESVATVKYENGKITVTGMQCGTATITASITVSGVTIASDSCTVRTAHTLTKTEAKDATYTEPGNTAYWTCSTCNKLFSDAAGTTETSKEAVTIKATGSSYIPPTTPADNVTNSGTTGTDTATTTADINTTASNGTANAVVDQTTANKIVDKATDNKSAEVVVDAKTSAGTADNTTVTLPTDTVQKIAEKTEAEVTVKTDAAEVTLDQKAVEAVAAKATGSDVQIVVEKTKDETKEMEFELKVASGGVVIGEFDGGNVKVTVKLNTTLAALKDAALTCVHIADDGTYTKVGGAKNNDGTYTFTTTHFSSYMIMAEEEADKVIDEQTLEAVKATKLVARTEMSKAKGKKAVKVYWYAKDGSELNFDGYEVYRSLKRYEGFGTKPFFETTKTKYYNTSIKKGTRYYYKVRGYKMINGEKAYTEYSTKAWRTVK